MDTHLPQTVEGELRRIAAHWPGSLKSPDERRAYRNALIALGQPMLVTETVDLALRELSGPAAPLPDDFTRLSRHVGRLEARTVDWRDDRPGGLRGFGEAAKSSRILSEVARRRESPPAESEKPVRWVDEAALRDAMAALSCEEDPEYRAEIEGQIAAIRARLADHGSWVDGAEGLQFVEAAPDPRDPPGVIRYVVIQPDGRRIPPGARIAGEP